MESDLGLIIQRISEEKGIGVFATKHYEAGDFIFEEGPIVSSQFAWNKEYKYLACDHCMRPLESTQENIGRLTQNPNIVLPHSELCPTNKLTHTGCDTCGAKYCSEECKQVAWNQYHKTMCENRQPLKALYNAWMNIHYPPETASIELLVRIIATIEQSPDKEQAFHNLMQFSHETVNRDTDVTLRLLGEKGMQNLSLIQPLLAQSLPTTVVSSLVTMEGLKSFFSLVGRNGQGIGTSVFSEWINKTSQLDLSQDEKEKLENFIDNTYKKMDKVVGPFLNCEGSGLYKLQRCLNHSCTPNSEVTFPHSNHILRVVAINDINPGDEICISYLDECGLSRSRHSRNKILRDFYLFECNCQKCMLDMTEEVDETSDDDEDMEENESD